MPNTQESLTHTHGRQATLRRRGVARADAHHCDPSSCGGPPVPRPRDAHECRRQEQARDRRKALRFDGQGIIRIHTTRFDSGSDKTRFHTRAPVCHINTRSPAWRA